MTDQTLGWVVCGVSTLVPSDGIPRVVASRSKVLRKRRKGLLFTFSMLLCSGFHHAITVLLLSERHSSASFSCDCVHGIIARFVFSRVGVKASNFPLHSFKSALNLLNLRV